MKCQQISNTGERRRRGEEGMALITTIMVLMLCSALMVGFVSAIVSDNRVSSINNDQTQAYAAAHAGLEKLTSDLSALFGSDFSPTASQVSALSSARPVVPGFQYVAPDGGSGYTVTFTPDANGNPAPADAAGTTISSGPYQGFRGIITPYDITVTARSTGGAEVRMRRTLQTIAVPVFQFGMFSETDLAFHAGEPFGFGGRVHTNGNLFLAQGNSTQLRLADRVTAVGEVIRTHLPNGLAATSGNGYAGTISVILAPNTFRNLLSNEGSLVGTLGSARNEPKWTQTSVGTYNSYIRNTLTGARQLDLPLVSQGARPIDLIRRPPSANENVTAPLVYAQRYYSMASLRILLSDTAADLTNLPTSVTATPPVALSAGLTYAPGVAPLTRPPLALSAGAAANGSLPANVHLSAANEPLLNGFIKIEMQLQNGTWEDVTGEILSLGIAGRNLADPNVTTLANRWNTWSNTCREPNPNAVIRLQRVRDVPLGASTAVTAAGIAASCGYTEAAGVVTAVTQNATDYWPNALYDPREGHRRDGLTGSNLALGGIMQYVELDVNNLRRWLVGQTGTRGTNAKNDNGFVVYFSDRRNNRNGTAAAPGTETGEYGFEDVVNMASTAGDLNNTLDTGEDVNGNGALDTYGSVPRNIPAGAVAPLDATATPITMLSMATPSKALVARANRQLFFRRALKIVNGGLGNLPTPGLSIASENPVYLQGNYNATAASVVAEPNVAAAIIADSVTLLSVSWTDVRSFLSPTESAPATVTATNPGRPADTTGYRVAFVTGKTIPFPKPSYASASFGSDGGAHNFLRNLENWNRTSVIQRYRGSLVSFYISRQANGTFKCCLGDTYVRGDRDWAFDTDFLSPQLLPPATPMFRDINTLTFRQLLRPNQ